MVAMSYLLVGILFLAIEQVLGLEDDIVSCMQIFNPETIDRNCCEILDSLDKIYEKGETKCDKLDPKDTMCGYFECMLTEEGLLKDGKVDEEEANKQLDKLVKDFPKDKTMIETLRGACLGGKYEMYPSEDNCPAMKYFICTYINIYLNCDSWKEDEFCTTISEDVKKCKAALEKS